MSASPSVPSHAAGARARGRPAYAIAMLAVATLLAMAGTGAVVALVSRAAFVDGAVAATTRFILAHGVLAASAAASPILAVLLVGYAYMQRAIRRRALAARAGA